MCVVMVCVVMVCVFVSVHACTCSWLQHDSTDCYAFRSWQPVIDYIDSKYEEYLNAESRVTRTVMPDTRVHCCLYFIAPTGHG